MRFSNDTACLYDKSFGADLKFLIVNADSDDIRFVSCRLSNYCNAALGSLRLLPRNCLLSSTIFLMGFSLRNCSHPAVWNMRRATSLSGSCLFHLFCLQARRTGCTEQPSHMGWVWWSNLWRSSNGRKKQFLPPDTFLWPSEFASGNLSGGSDPSLTAWRLRVCNVHLYNSCDFRRSGCSEHCAHALLRGRRTDWCNLYSPVLKWFPSLCSLIP